MAQGTSTAAAATARPKLLALPGGTPVALSEMAVPIAVVAIVLALIMPMPSMLLDFLIVLDITLSVIVLLVSVYIRKAVDFNVFPTTLLLLTLYRLALNISSARLILLNGNTGTAAAVPVLPLSRINRAEEMFRASRYSVSNSNVVGNTLKSTGRRM